MKKYVKRKNRDKVVVRKSSDHNKSSPRQRKKKRQQKQKPLMDVASKYINEERAEKFEETNKDKIDIGTTKDGDDSKHEAVLKKIWERQCADQEMEFQAMEEEIRMRKMRRGEM